MYSRRDFSEISDRNAKCYALTATLAVLRLRGYVILDIEKRKHIINVIKDGVITRVFWEARGVDNGYEYRPFVQKGRDHWSRIRTSAARYTAFFIEGCTEFWMWIRTPGVTSSLPLVAMWNMTGNNNGLSIYENKKDSILLLGIETASLYTYVDNTLVPTTWDDQNGDNLSAASQNRFFAALAA